MKKISFLSRSSHCPVETASTKERFLNIIGHGIDLIELDNFARLVDEPESDFVVRCFTEAERAAAEDGPDRARRLAGRFAAKEAIAKALGTGFDGNVAPQEIEIRNLPSGRPEVVLHGAAADVAANLGISSWQLSISHADTAAVASAIALGPGLPDS